MPSIGHVMVGMAAGRLQARQRKELVGSMLLFSVVSMLPDADAIGFKLGVPYGAPFGHRGAMHSLAMAVILAVALGLAARLARRPALRVGLVAFAALALHDLCDAVTNGGLGVALWWPFSNERIFLPWRPLPVAPIGLNGMLAPRGLRVMAAELIVFAPFLLYALVPRRGVRAPEASQPAVR
ncbi:MAG: metal-dependent hydrolase [Deltaproteobacteria bacterium]|nr:metal-dependent hydrolase [Deltaproteobacteria bacterium]